MTLRLAIVGRPNVGKSTLFNRLARKKLAIVDDQPGVTRDWRAAPAQLLDMPIEVIDTAGLEESFDGSIESRMRQQTEAALKQADAILFLVDGRSGIVPMDRHFADFLRRQDKPVILAVNKCESENAVQTAMAEAYGLGLGQPVPLSGAHGHGFDDLYIALQEYIPAEDDEAFEDDIASDNFIPDEIDEIEGNEDFDFSGGVEEDTALPIKIAIVGRPNVGKSTFINTIVGENRVMTGPEAGITRDSIAVAWEYEGRKIRLVDTAGLRRQGRIHDRVERMSAQETLRAIRLAQVVIVMIDARDMLERQDLRIAQLAAEEGRAVILAVNKWDLIRDQKERLEEIRYEAGKSLSQVRHLPIVTLSALKGNNIRGVMNQVLETFDTWTRRVSTGQLNRWLQATCDAHPPPLVNGRPNRLRYITQIKSKPPTFGMWVSKPDALPDSYQRYLINRLAEKYDLQGIVMRLVLRKSKNPFTS